MYASGPPRIYPQNFAPNGHETRPQVVSYADPQAMITQPVDGSARVYYEVPAPTNVNAQHNTDLRSREAAMQFQL